MPGSRAVVDAKVGPMSLVSVVFTVYYNEATLPELFRRLRAVAAEHPALEFEFVCVDDASEDGSFDVIRSEGSEDRRIRGVRLSRNFGANAAVAAGLANARGDCVVCMSADLQDPPELIPQMIEAWREGAEVVLAARRERADPLVTRLLAAGFNSLFRRFVFSDYPKSGFDFMLIGRRVVDIIVQMGEKNSHFPGQVFWLGFPRAMLHYDRAARAAGTSRWTLGKKTKFFIDAFAAFSYLPLRAAACLGLLLAFVGFMYALSVILTRIFGLTDEPAGFSALMVAVLIIGGTQLVVTGMIGEYIWRVLEEARRRPLFVVESTVNIDREDGGPQPGAHPVLAGPAEYRARADVQDTPGRPVEDRSDADRI